MSHIKTWVERCNEHPNNQSGMVSNDMIQARMQEEIDDLRAEIERLTRERNEARAEYARLRDDIERIENDAWHDGAKHGTSH